MPTSTQALFKFLPLILVVLMMTLSGCKYSLESRNDFSTGPQYTGNAVPRIGILRMDEGGPGEDKLQEAIVSALEKNAKVIYPYDSDSDKVDYVLGIDLHLEKRGYSGNFFVSWPGYYVFLPALHGFKYRHAIRTGIAVEHVATGRKASIEKDNLVRIRQSDLNRTWIQAGWLWLWPIWDIAAIIGGGINTSYDESITGIAVEDYRRDYGNYIRYLVTKEMEAIGE